MCEELGQVRVEAYGVIYYLLDAVMLYHGTYFRRGVKRIFEELAALPIDEIFVQTIQKVVVSKECCQIRDLLKQIILYVESHIRKEKEKAEPSEAYMRAGISVKRFADVDEFVANYLSR